MPLNTQQKAAVSQFVTFTNADKRTAEKQLRSCGWNVQSAVDEFFGGQAKAIPNPHEAALDKMFDKYRDLAPGEPDTMSTESTMAYLNDLSIDLESITVLVFCEVVEAPSVGEVARTGFVAGWSKYDAATITTQKKVMKDLTHKLQTETGADRNAIDSIFRRTYKSTHRVALPSGTRAVPLELAAVFWKLLFGPEAGFEWKTKTTPWLDWWLEYLEKNWKKAVNRDLWEQTLRFSIETMKDESMKWWSEESAWPGVIDDFVGWVKERRKDAGGEAMDTE